MTIAEIIMTIVVVTICAVSGISIVYASIVNTIERYNIRKEERALKIYTKTFEVMHKIAVDILNDINNKKEAEKMNESFEKVKNYFEE